MLPSFNDIRYFLEVAETKNISRAAERLGISQPSLSLAIKRVEESLGSPLLTRSKGGVQLNAIGKTFQLESRNLLNQWENIKSRSLKNESEVRGQYSIGVHPSVAQYTLGQFLPNLLSLNKELEISLKHDISRRVTEQVISHKVDVGIVVNPTPHPDLVIKPLLTDKVSLWTKAKPSNNQKPQTHPAVLICDPELAQTQSILKKLHQQKLVFSRTLHSSNLDVIANLVEAGSGVGILPGRVASLHNIKLFKPNTAFFDDRIHLIYRVDSQKTLAFKTILEAIRTVR